MEIFTLFAQQYTKRARTPLHTQWKKLASYFRIQFHPVLAVLVVAIFYNLAHPLPTYSDSDLSGITVQTTIVKKKKHKHQDKQLPAPLSLPPIQQATPRVVKTFTARTTWYESRVGQTDANPFNTASGSRVHWGTIATNCLPFGTKVRIPQLYGNTIFTVEDRHSPRFGCHLVDVWTDHAPGHQVQNGQNITIEVMEHIPGVN